MSAKKVSISFDETTINLLDAELRRRNDRAERTGQPTVSRSALVRSYIHDALNRERIEELKRLEREANPVIVADLRSSYMTSDLRGMADREQIIERVAGMVPLDATGNLEQ